MSDRGLQMLWDKTDATFFQLHSDRCFHIRNAHMTEHQGEFWSLGEHKRDRRRIILCRVDAEMKPLPDNKVLKIPFLAFADESIEDTDDVLFPIVRDIMLNELKKAKR